jgi:regulatory protein
MSLEENRPPPEWLGDVSAGVDAWTRRSASAPPETMVEEGAPAPVHRDGGSATSSGTIPRRRGRRQPPPEDAAVQVPEADPESVARKILLDQLTGQARSRKQLGDKLAAKNVPAEVATRLLDRFEEVGLVDDEAFARSWIASRRSAGPGGGKGLARRALAQELRRKGIDDEVAREALDEIDPADEEAAARFLVRKKLRTLSQVDDATATRRLVGLLARKGYGSGMAFAVVKDELASAGREAPGADG